MVSKISKWLENGYFQNLYKFSVNTDITTFSDFF